MTKEERGLTNKGMKQIKRFKDKKEKLPDIVKYTSVVTSPVDNSSAEDEGRRERDSASQ